MFKHYKRILKGEPKHRQESPSHPIEPISSRQTTFEPSSAFVPPTEAAIAAANANRGYSGSVLADKTREHTHFSPRIAAGPVLELQDAPPQAEPSVVNPSLPPVSAALPQALHPQTPLKGSLMHTTHSQLLTRLLNTSRSHPCTSKIQVPATPARQEASAGPRTTKLPCTLPTKGCRKLCRMLQSLLQRQLQQVKHSCQSALAAAYHPLPALLYRQPCRMLCCRARLQLALCKISSIMLMPKSRRQVKAILSCALRRLSCRWSLMMMSMT